MDWIDHGIGALHPCHDPSHRLNLDIVLCWLCRHLSKIGFIVHCDKFHRPVHVTAIAVSTMDLVNLIECHAYICATFKGVFVSITNHIDALVPVMSVSHNLLPIWIVVEYKIDGVENAQLIKPFIMVVDHRCELHSVRMSLIKKVFRIWIAQGIVTVSIVCASTNTIIQMNTSVDHSMTIEKLYNTDLFGIICTWVHWNLLPF